MSAPRKDDYTRAPKLKQGQKWKPNAGACFIYFDGQKRRWLRVDRQNLVDARGNPVLNEKKGKPRKRCVPTFYGPDGKSYDTRPPWWRPVLYRLPELLAARQQAKEEERTLTVFFPEGEAKANLIASWGHVAVCSSGGANAWDATLAAELVGCDVISLPDNDDEGRRFVDSVGRALAGVANSHKVLELPNLGPSEDIVDWARAGRGNTPADFEELAKTARPWTPYFPERGSKTYDVVCAADVSSRARDWVWEGHLLRGALELTTGIKCVGKSQIQTDWISRATTGRVWPDGSKGCPPGNVIMVTAEDNYARTIVPRLIACKADLSRVFFLERIKMDKKGRMFLLGEDLDMLEQMIRDIGDIALVTIDPITAYMGKIDSHSATDVRGTLGPLKDFTERLHVAVSAITHPPKYSSQRAIDNFIGSQAYIAAARIGHLVIPEVDIDGNPTGRNLLTMPASNEGAKMPTLAYQQRVFVLPDPDPISGKTIDAAYVEWAKDAVTVTADQALAAVKTSENGGAKGKKSEDLLAARAFVQGMLVNGPLPAKDIIRRGEDHGFSEDQLKRARTHPKFGEPIQAKKERGKPNGAWWWGGLPSETEDMFSPDEINNTEHQLKRGME